MNEQANINEILIHPVYNHYFFSAEHVEGELDYPGDALGRDCIIGKYADGLVRMYSGEGKKNEDWFGWNTDVLAPFDSEIEEVNHCESINQPGIPSKDRAGIIVFRRADGVKIMQGHVMDIKVKVGDVVKAGDVVGKVGNNGTSFMPHIHIGAWKDNEPLQIRFDLREAGKLGQKLGRAYIF